MSVPYGGSQPAVHQPAGGPTTGPNLGFLLAVVAAGLGLVIYACSFADDASGIANTLLLPLFLAGGLLAGATALPRAPRHLLLVATVLTALGALMLLQAVIKAESDTPAIVFVILIAGLLQAAACAVALLFDAGIVKMTPKPAYAAAPPWGGPQSGQFPQQGYGAAPGQYGGAQQYGGQQYGGAQYGAMPGGQGQPAGGPGGPGPGSPGSPGGPGGPGGGGPGGAGGPGGGSQGGPGGSGDQRSQPQFGQQPYGQQPYGGQPGTPPGGFGGPA